MTLKKFAGTDMLWDDHDGRWIRPYTRIEKPKTAPRMTMTNPKRDPAEMTWRETLFETYKTCRQSLNWARMKACHDREDQEYFDSLDHMLQETK